MRNTFFDKFGEEALLEYVDVEYLRDNMTELENTISELGEACVIEVTRSQNAQGFEECIEAVDIASGLAGMARRKLEKVTGKKVVSRQNFEHLNQSHLNPELKDFIENHKSDKDAASAWDALNLNNEELVIIVVKLSKRIFGMTPKQCRRHKGLKEKDDLASKMTALEHTFNEFGYMCMLEIIKSRNAQKFEDYVKAAIIAGNIAGKTRRKLEKITGEGVVVSKQKYYHPVVHPAYLCEKRKLYKSKRYPNSWIGARIKGINTRMILNNEWEKRGLK